MNRHVRLPRRPAGALPVALLALLASSATAQGQPPTPTPTSRPRLSGGFGKPRATPAPTPAVAANPAGSEVVRAAGEKRGALAGKPGVSITNETLITDPSKGKLTTSQTAPAAPKPAAAPAAGEAPAAEPSLSAEEAKWRAAARSARERVESLKELVAQYEREAAKLESDFYAWDDGQYRDGVIKPAWDRKKEELEQARKDLTTAEAELTDLPEKARKAGALPGWLRE
jgi:hypothetical protein